MVTYLHTYKGKRMLHKTKKAALKHQKKVGGTIRKQKTVKRKKEDYNKLIRTTFGVGLGIGVLRAIT